MILLEWWTTGCQIFSKFIGKKNFWEHNFLEFYDDTFWKMFSSYQQNENPVLTLKLKSQSKHVWDIARIARTPAKWPVARQIICNVAQMCIFLFFKS